jgi:hypothetical protein
MTRCPWEILNGHAFRGLPEHAEPPPDICSLFRPEEKDGRLGFGAGVETGSSFVPCPGRELIEKGVM